MRPVVLMLPMAGFISPHPYSGSGPSKESAQIAGMSSALRSARSEEHTSELQSLMRISYCPPLSLPDVLPVFRGDRWMLLLLGRVAAWQNAAVDGSGHSRSSAVRLAADSGR